MEAFVESSNPFPATLSSEIVPLAYLLTSNRRKTTILNAAAEAEVMLASRNPKKCAGRKKFRETRHPIYRGVRMRDNGKWVCELREPKKKLRVWLGTHPTAIMAARAHDVAAFAFRGRSACLNFADSVWRLPVPKSGKIEDIQKAAAEAAESFRYTEDEAEILETEELPEILFYLDEEDIFEMPEYFASMAEGLMVAPPQAVGYGSYGDKVEVCDHECLWSF
ncbi:hypothetical protein LXL04_035292 [Taraxacum kok-saghyz]